MYVCNSMGILIHSITLKQKHTVVQKFHCNLFLQGFLLDWSEASPNALPKEQ